MVRATEGKKITDKTPIRGDTVGHRPLLGRCPISSSLITRMLEVKQNKPKIKQENITTFARC